MRLRSTPTPSTSTSTTSPGCIALVFPVVPGRDSENVARGLSACDVLRFLTHDQNQLHFVMRVVRAGGQHDILAGADNAGTRFPEQTGKLGGRNRLVVHL